VTVYAHIVGWGKYIPEKVVTNDDIAQFMDTSDEWIRSRTGIAERRFAGEQETTASMAVAAARVALDRARIAPSTVDLIIVATLTPEYTFPSTASLVQDAIGANRAGAFDLSAACSGFLYALSMASNAIRAGSAKAAVVIGAETLSRVLDDQDRTTYPLFGDGAGAVVLQAFPIPGGVMAYKLGSDGSGAEHLLIPAGGSKNPASQTTINARMHYIKMNGREVYRFATRVMGRVSKEVCEKAGVSVSEIDMLIPHQANIRIIRSASKYLGISDDKVFTNLQKYGNTSAASVPIALCEAIEEGRVHTNDKIVMVGFGGGLTWAAAVVKWGLPMPYKRRQWWYRGIRWVVYRWANLQSTYRRMRRQVENKLPKDEAGFLGPEKKARKTKEKRVEKDKQPENMQEVLEEVDVTIKQPALESRPGTNGHSTNGTSMPVVEDEPQPEAEVTGEEVSDKPAD